MITATFTLSNGVTTTTSSILRNSVVVDLRRINALKSTSSSASFTLKAEPLTNTLVEALLQDTGDVLVELKEDNTNLFKGYLSKQSNYSVGISGCRDFKVSVEDLGVRLLKAPLDEHTWNNVSVRDVVVEIIEPILGAKKIDIDIPDDALEDTIFLSSTKSDSAEDLLIPLLYEFGYYYYFDVDGTFCIRELNLNTNAEPDYYLGGTDADASLVAHSGEAITLHRKIGSYSQASVCYPTLKYREDVNIYEVKDLTVVGGTWWDGAVHSAINEDDLPQSSEASERKSVAGLYPQTCSYPFTFTEDITVADVSWDTAWEGSAFPGATCSYKAYFTNASGKIVSNVVSQSANYTWVWQDWRTVSAKFVLSERPSNLVFEHTNWAGPIRYFENIKIKAGTSTASATTSNRTVTDLDQGRKIWAYDNFTTICDPPLETAYDVLEPAGDSRTINLLINSSVSARMPDGKHYNKFAAKANCWCTDVDQNFVYATKAGEALTSDGSACFRYNASYITNKETATALVKRLATFNCYCQSEYKFYAHLGVEPGSVVLITDDVYSGLQAKIFITEAKYNPYRELYEYVGYALSDISSINDGIGDDGNTFVNPRVQVQVQRYAGSWSPTTTYYNNEQYADIVTFEGGSYICLRTNQNVPPTNTEYWGVMAAPGFNGNALIEYGISSSDTSFVSVVDWGCIPSNSWVYGTYPWRREVLVDPETGEKSYSNPILDQELLSSFISLCELKFTPNQTSYTVNNRVSDRSNEIKLFITDKGFQCDSYAWSTSNPLAVVTDSREGYYILSIPYKGFNDLETTVTLKGYRNGEPVLPEDSFYSTVLYGVDDSDANHFFGKSSTGDPSSLGAYPILEGDFYVDTSTEESHIKMYTLLDDGETYGWRVIRNSDRNFDNMCSIAQNDVLSTVDPGSVTSSEFGYLQNIIAGYINADYVSALTLEKGYTEDADGTPLTGYLINSEGTPTIKAGSATFGNVTIKGLSTFDSPALTTTNTATESHSLTGTYLDCEHTYYNYDDINRECTGTGWVSASGIYNGVSVSGYRGVVDTSLNIATVSDVSDSAKSITFTCPCSGDYTVYIQPTIYAAPLGLALRSGSVQVKDMSTGVVVYNLSEDGGWTSQFTKVLRLTQNHSYQLTVDTPKNIYWIWNKKNGSASVYDNFSAKGFATASGFTKIASGYTEGSADNLTVNNHQITAVSYVLFESTVPREDGVSKPQGVYLCNEGTSQVTKNGTHYSGYYKLTVSQAGLIFEWSNGDSIQIGIGEHLRSFTYSASTLVKNGSVEAVDVLPKTDLNTIGSPDRPWAVGYFTSLPEGSSSRTVKKDIQDYTNRALDLINNTKIVSYRYNNIADDHRRVGFIAEDTDHTLSVDGSHIDSGSCIGVLLKAVQELSAEIEELKTR